MGAEIRASSQFSLKGARLEGFRPPNLEFIARVTSHIPDKGQVMVRYYGLYANAHLCL